MGNYFSQPVPPMVTADTGIGDDHYNQYWTQIFGLANESYRDRTKVCCILSNAIYDPASFETTLCDSYSKFDWFPKPLGFIQSRQSFGIDSTVYAVVEFESYSVVCIRGTDTNDDWTANLTADSINFGSLTGIHRGFAMRATDIPAEMIVEKMNSEKPIIFTGHSQGGAVAVISASSLLNKGKGNVSSITFGAPSVVLKGQTWSSSIKPISNTHFRYYFTNDPVASVTHPIGYFSFENCLLLSDINNTYTLTKTDGVKFQAPTLKDDRIHSMQRYSDAILGLGQTGLGMNVARSNRITNVKKMVMDIDIHWEDLKADFLLQNNQYYLVVSGTGFYAGIVRAELLIQENNATRTLIPSNISYTIQNSELYGNICNFHVKFSNVGVVTTQSSKQIGGMTDNPENWVLSVRLFNGFDLKTVQLKWPQPQQSVAIFGKVGQGKTTLTRALEQFSINGTCPNWTEEDEASFEQAPAAAAHTFFHNGVFYYETPGLHLLEKNDYIQKMNELFTRSPPQLILLTWTRRAKIYTDQEDLIEAVQLLKTNTQGKIPIWIVFTDYQKSKPDVPLKIVVDHIKAILGLQSSRHFVVNSLNDVKGSNVAFGIDTLYGEIQKHLELTKNAPRHQFQMRTYLKWVESLVEKNRTAFAVAGAIVGAGIGIRLVVFDNIIRNQANLLPLQPKF